MNLPESKEKVTIVDTEDGTRIEAQYNPSEVTDEKTAGWASQKVPGMSHPRYQFGSGGDRTVTLKLEFYGSGILSDIKSLRSLCYPENGGSMLKNGPHKVKILFGPIFTSELWIVDSVKVRQFYKFSPGLDPNRADVDVTFKEYVDSSKNIGSARG